MAKQILGGYTFEWDPKGQTIPGSKKQVAEVKTHTGSELFSWPALVQGQQIELYWDIMSIGMYNALRTLYLAPDVITWNPQYLRTYEVMITALDGEYFEVILDDNGYRKDVVMELNIRSST